MQEKEKERKNGLKRKKDEVVESVYMKEKVQEKGKERIGRERKRK